MSVPPARPEVRAAPFWRRLLADLADLVLLVGVVAALWRADLVGPHDLPAQRYDWIDYTAEILGEHMAQLRPPMVLLVTLGFMYAVTLRTLLGRTLGEALLGLRLVTREAAPVGPIRSVVHAAGTLCGLLALLLGYVWAAVDRDRQGLAEYLSGTLLIVGRPGAR